MEISSPAKLSCIELKGTVSGIWVHSGPVFAVLSVIVALGLACNSGEGESDGDGTATATATATGTSTGTATGTATGTISGASNSASSGESTVGESSTATDSDTTGMSTSGGSTTMGVSDSDTTGTSGTSSTSGDTTTTDATTGTSGDTTGDECIPVSDDEMTCDGVDDDCNGIIDDVDLGDDGFCDCLQIALFGSPGFNANSKFEAWLEDQGTGVSRIGEQGDPVTPEMLSAYDVIILDHLPRGYSAEEAGYFRDWVEAGGGLMAMTGHVADETIAVDYPNSIVGPMGVGYIGGLLSQAVTDFTAHPLTTGLTSVTFLGGFRVEETMPGDTTIIAKLPQGPVAIAEVRELGRIYLWGDEWVQFDSEWQQMPEIKIFWQNALSWLTPDNFCTIPG